MIIKTGHCLKIYHFSVAHLFFRHNLMLCRNPSFIVWNQSVFAQYNTFVTCYALNKIVEEMMHHAFGQGNKMPLSGFTVQWPLIQTVADKALTFVNYHHLYRNHQHHYITTNSNVDKIICQRNSNHLSPPPSLPLSPTETSFSPLSSIHTPLLLH